MASPTPTRPLRRISDLQRSAFWIYGVTAMVMREPLGVVIRHASEAGLANWQVRLELLRVAVILLLLARFFLVSGIYFEEVFMQPDSADRFPHRSYPVDFLAGFVEFLVGAGATTSVGTHLLIAGELAPFTVLAAMFLMVNWVWLAIAVLRRFSSLALIARNARFNATMLIASTFAWVLIRVTGGGAVFADQVALLTLTAFNVYGVWKQVRRYELFDEL